jgi:hypothetical protein
MRLRALSGALAGVGLVALAVAGCSASGALDGRVPGPTGSTASASAPASGPARATGDGGGGGVGEGSARVRASCGTADAATAVRRAVATMHAPEVGSWDAGAADTDGYDPCAALSWAVVGVVDGTPSSPNAILLFHDGRFLGTATATQYPFEPTVIRRSPDTIAVAYRYAKPADANADPTGTTLAMFTWSTTDSQVYMSGDTPPAP